MAKDRLGESTAGVNPRDVVIKIISEPPAKVYRRQVELGVTPLEVVSDENATELRLGRDGYHETSVDFEGASPGKVLEVRVKLEPLASNGPSTLSSPSRE
jgi:hypothetical protein